MAEAVDSIYALQSGAKIIMGKADISEFDTFVENWKNQGGDQILKEINDELGK